METCWTPGATVTQLNKVFSTAHGGGCLPLDAKRAHIAGEESTRWPSVHPPLLGRKCTDCLRSPGISVLGFETSGDAEAEGCVKTP